MSICFFKTWKNLSATSLPSSVKSRPTKVQIIIGCGNEMTITYWFLLIITMTWKPLRVDPLPGFESLLLRHKSMTYVKINQLSCWFFLCLFPQPPFYWSALPLHLLVCRLLRWSLGRYVRAIYWRVQVIFQRLFCREGLERQVTTRVNNIIDPRKNSF